MRSTTDDGSARAATTATASAKIGTRSRTSSAWAHARPDSSPTPGSYRAAAVSTSTHRRNRAPDHRWRRLPTYPSDRCATAPTLLQSSTSSQRPELAPDLSARRAEAEVAGGMAPPSRRLSLRGSGTGPHRPLAGVPAARRLRMALRIETRRRLGAGSPSMCVLGSVQPGQDRERRVQAPMRGAATIPQSRLGDAACGYA